MDATSTCACTAHTGRRRHQQRANDYELVHVRLKQHAAQRTLSSQWYLQYLPPALSSAYRRPHSTQRTRAFPGKLVTLLVMVVMVMAALGASSCTAFVAHSTPTTPPTTIHTTQALPAQGSQADASLSLCSEVDATLVHLTTTLETFGVPFTWPSNHDVRHPHTRSKAHTNFASGAPGTGEATRARAHVVPVDLSSIQRMMKAFGCCNTGTRHGSRRPSAHGVSDVQEAQQRDVPHVQPDAPRGSGNGRFLPAKPLQHQRVRRADPGVQPGRCTLASVIEGTCPGPIGNVSLVVTVDDAAVLQSVTNASVDFLHQVAARTLTLNVQGRDLTEEPLMWLLSVARWPLCHRLVITGLHANALHLSLLNNFPSVVQFVVRDSERLRAVNTQGLRPVSLLSKLQFSNTSLSGFNDDAFKGMASLRNLYLAGNLIDRLPATLFDPLTALTGLHLDRNIISRLDARAFVRTTALEFLTLSENDFHVLPPGLFHPLTRLRELRLHHNPVQHLATDDFDGLVSVTTLDLSTMLLSSLPVSVFGNCTRLMRLQLNNNFLTQLADTSLSGLSRLTRLDLSGNRLPSIPADVFHELTAVETLDMSRNQLQTLPSGIVDKCIKLSVVKFTSNLLSRLPRLLFHRTRVLTEVFLEHNRLTTLDGQLDGLSLLKRVALDNNLLTVFDITVPFPVLKVLTLSQNPMEKLPNLTQLPMLTQLRLQNHRIRQVDLTPVFGLPPLQVLELDAAPETNSRVFIDPTAFSTDHLDHLAELHLHTLSLINVNVLATFTFLSLVPALNLRVLHAGWVGATQTRLPMNVICKVLADEVHELALMNTDYTRIELCPSKTFRSVLLQDNKQLESIIIHNSLVQLNVSGCTSLPAIDVPSVDVLDISSTRIQPSPALCTRWGRRILFARNLEAEHFRSLRAAVSLGFCLQQVDVLDLSGNDWIHEPNKINEVAGAAVALSPVDFAGGVSSRENPPVLQLKDTPVECTLELSNEELMQDNDGVLSNEITYALRCGCAQGHRRGASGRCERIDVPVVAIAAGSVIGGLFILVPVVAWLYRRYARSHKSDKLHMRLLSERDEEVMALKKAWEIEYEELRLIKRVAAGAFGIVFKAKWDTLMVAVKVLQHALMAVDESTVLEFEKEVEFLRKARHPNVVRFFGAGTDPNGSPFLVLEFVAMGSLKDLLEKNLQAVLDEAQAAMGGMEDDDEDDAEDVAVVTADVGDELTLVSTPTVRPRNSVVLDEVMTVWDLKLQLLRDVASGMSFIHSLDQIHRSVPGYHLVSHGQPLAVAEWYKQLAYTCMADNPAHRPSFEELKNKRLAEQQVV
ncbi:TKL protein kinase [Salpingoeca rosetta]|uniref:TKL protein kinase n=1 Tax=Salpingoeca rosetta (strain ATCC 50818 / BSB-021) TaxID=946362 RepID=F2UQR1_SALR5|nr:TKL protein kinase [Salpingoeca rosetta]EGD79966.1 TKL protein kinase [Salpingoeca rosetta]|eukprot:XP_004988587.1 TKL protein kinase [Salpingoeca rosetta]